VSDSAEALREENERLLRFLYEAPVGLMLVRRDGSIELSNPAVVRLLLPIARRPALENLFEVFEDAAPELRNMMFAYVPASGLVCDQYRILYPRQKSSPPDLVLTATIYRLEPDAFMVTLLDTTKTVRYELQLHRSQQRMQALFENVRDYAIYTTDKAGLLDDWNRSLGRLTGYQREDAIGRHVGMLCVEEESAPAVIAPLLQRASREGSAEVEGWRVRRDGSRFWADTLVAPLRDLEGEVDGYAFITRDISERRREEENLRTAASTDFLTGAYNRRHLEAAGLREFAAHRASGKPLSVVMLDIDHFKRVNDTWGHDAGDKVLVALAGLVSSAIRGADVFARMGGEEFVVVLPGTPVEGAVALAEKLRLMIKALSIGVEGSEIRFTSSFGVSAAGEVASFESLLQYADEALYAAKSTGRDQVCAYRPAGR